MPGMAARLKAVMAFERKSVILLAFWPSPKGSFNFTTTVEAFCCCGHQRKKHFCAQKRWQCSIPLPPSGWTGWLAAAACALIALFCSQKCGFHYSKIWADSANNVAKTMKRAKVCFFGGSFRLVLILWQSKGGTSKKIKSHF